MLFEFSQCQPSIASAEKTKCLAGTSFSKNFFSYNPGAREVVACSACLSVVTFRAIPSLPAVILFFNASHVHVLLWLCSCAATIIVLQKLVVDAPTSSKATN